MNACETETVMDYVEVSTGDGWTAWDIQI